MSLGWLDIKTSLNRFLVEFSVAMCSFSGTTYPVTPKAGQTFYNTSTQKIYQYSGNSWQEQPKDFFLFDFDAHAVQVKFPDHDLIGLKALSVTVDEHLIEGSVMIGVGILADTYLRQHDKIIHLLFEALKPESLIKLYDISQVANGADTGKPLKVMAGTSVFPMAKADERPIQFISFDFGCNITV
jgi:hypothetical protein